MGIALYDRSIMYTQKKQGGQEMATCGDCMFFKGGGKICDGNQGTRSSSMSICSSCHKVPASLLQGKKCGGCRLFNGGSKICGGNQGTRSANMAACSGSYSAIPG